MAQRPHTASYGKQDYELPIYRRAQKQKHPKAQKVAHIFQRSNSPLSRGSKQIKVKAGGGLLLNWHVKLGSKKRLPSLLISRERESINLNTWDVICK